MSGGESLIMELWTNGCQLMKNEINYLEHVQAVISVYSGFRGNLVITLRSPMGTNTTLLDRRSQDYSSDSFSKWPFTTGIIYKRVWGVRDS
jgi:subtilisin-like proprotein convertase family protein